MDLELLLSDIRTHIELYLAYSKLIKPISAKVKDLFSKKKAPYELELEESENFLKLCEVRVKIIKLLKETKELKEEPTVANFLEKNMPDILNVKNRSEFDFDIIEQDGKLKIFYPEEADKLIQKIKDEKEREITEKVNAIPIKYAQRFYEYKYENKVASKEVVDIVDKLNIKHKSLLSLSIWVEKLYDEKRIDEVEETKSEIYKRYDSYGMKFCSLYIKGYLKSLLSNLSEQYKKDCSTNIDEEISNFVSQKAQAIYFIHPYMDENDVKRTVTKIDEYLRDKIDYIAIHSLGINIKKAKLIKKNISIPSNSDYTEKIIETVKKYEYSIVWYREGGVKIYSLISEHK